MKLTVRPGTDYRLPSGQWARCIAIEHHQVSFVYSVSREPTAISMQLAALLWGEVTVRPTECQTRRRAFIAALHRKPTPISIA